MPGKWQQAVVGLWYLGTLRGWERRAHAITVLGRREERGRGLNPHVGRNGWVRKGTRVVGGSPWSPVGLWDGISQAYVSALSSFASGHWGIS